MAYENIIVSKEEHVTTVTLNRPNKLNAMNPQMNRELKTAIEDIISDDDTRVVVFAGAGKGFCAGADIGTQHARIEGELEKKPRKEIILPLPGWEFFLPLTKMSKVSIAAVNGIAYGVGLSLTLACDIRIASEKARFTSGYVNMGLTPGGGHTFFLTRIVGISKAIELMCTGDIIDAKEAERIGLVRQTVPAEDLASSVEALAKKLANRASVSVELIKRLAHMGLENTLEHQIYLESWAQKIAFETDDHKEAVEAFFDKRTPFFKGS